MKSLRTAAIHARPGVCNRRGRQHRQCLTLTRLSALIVLGFMSGLSASGAGLHHATGLRTGGPWLLPEPASMSELLLSGDYYGPGMQLVVDGAGSIARVAQYAALVDGASLVNSGGGKTIIAGRLELIGSGSRLAVGTGSEVLVEATGSMNIYSTTGLDIDGGRLTNRGRVVADLNTVANRGVIDNWGHYRVTSGNSPTAGGVFNNQAGGEVLLQGELRLGGTGGGSFNMLAGSTLKVNSFVVAEGYRQVNAGSIDVSGGYGSASVLGELQIGDGGTTGTVNTLGEQILAELATSAILFNRSDDNSFEGGVAGAGYVVKRNQNQLTFNGYNTYTGRTVVEAGRLVLQTRVASREFHVAALATLDIDAGARVDEQRLQGRFTGGGTLAKTGNLGLSLASESTAMALDAGARIEVMSGSFTMVAAGADGASADWLQNRSALFVANGALFSGRQDNVRVDALSGGGRIQSGSNQAGYEGFRFGVAGGSGNFSGVLADTDAANGHVGSFIKLGAGTQVVTGANTFTGPLSILEGKVQIGDGGTSGSLATRLIDNQAELTFSRGDDSSFNGLVSGSGNVTQSGTGRLTLAQTATAGSSAYTGVTNVKAGTLVLAGTNNSRLHNISQGAVLELEVASGGRDGTVTTQFAGQGTLRKTGSGQSVWTSSQATFALAAGSLIDVQAGSFAGGSYGNEDWSLNQSALQVAAGASFYGVEANVRVDGLSGAGRITSGYVGAGYTAFTMGVANGSGDFSGVLADSTADERGHFVKVGSGVQTLSGTSTYSGGTTIGAGTLQIGNGGTSGSIVGDVLNNGLLRFNRADDLSFAGVISGSGALGKLGAGTLTLSGSNTYSGGTVLAGGVLSVARDANLGSGALGLQGGTLRNTGAIVTSRTISLEAGGGVFDTAGGYLTINGNVDGVGGLGKTGGDILTLAGAQAYTEATVISAGTLKFSANGTTASSVATPSVAIGSGARLIFADTQTYGGSITGAGLLMHEFGGTTTLTGSATHTGGTMISGGTLQLGDGGTRGGLAGDVVDNGSLVFNRSDDVVFAGAISGSGGVAQVGQGTLTLTGTHSYSGTTTVSTGEIRLNGEALASAFNVYADATFSGNAQVGALLVAGTLAPGNSPGRISAAATVFASGGQYLWEISDGSGLAGIGFDLLSVTGTLSIAATADSRFTVTLSSLLGDNTSGQVSNFDAHSDQTYTLVSTSDGILGFSADRFTIEAGGFSNDLYGGQWTLAAVGNNLNLQFTAAVPEPSTWALMLVGCLGLGAIRRRRD